MRMPAAAARSIKFCSIWMWHHETGEEEGMQYLKRTFTSFYDAIAYDDDNRWHETDPPFAACERGDVDQLDDLVQGGLDVNRRKADGESLLMNAAGEPQPRIVEYLLSKGANFEAQDAEGRRALHYAARVGALDCTKLLVAAGASVNVSDEEGWTPLLKSIGYRDDRLANFLIQSGADANADAGEGMTPLALCMERNECDQQPLLGYFRRAGARA